MMKNNYPCGYKNLRRFENVFPDWNTFKNAITCLMVEDIPNQTTKKIYNKMFTTFKLYYYRYQEIGSIYNKTAEFVENYYRQISNYQKFLNKYEDYSGEETANMYYKTDNQNTKNQEVENKEQFLVNEVDYKKTTLDEITKKNKYLEGAIKSLNSYFYEKGRDLFMIYLNKSDII